MQTVPQTSLFTKYNVPVPRYTSYPTVPYWQETPPSQAEWTRHLQAALRKDGAISLYIHLPFCESLCTYCGCNTRITKQHAVEAPYIQTLLKEWRLYVDAFGKKPLIRELHLGGGTPTFFSPSNLHKLLDALLQQAIVPADHEFSFEAHPSSTSKAHLQVLFDLGFRRISIGVQDFAPEILHIINRHQTEEQVRQVTDWAREIGYESVNYDIIFGLPLQKPAHIESTMKRVCELRPDRLAFYSYAHVPWIKPGQRAYSDLDLPSNEEKRYLYELGRQRLEEAGYIEIGMDHFALPHDGLYKAMEEGRLHRNFMGYTPLHTELMVGLGASAIGDTWTAFGQNEKRIEDYTARVEAGLFPIFKGHLLTEEDLLLRRHILDLMCQMQTSWQSALPALAEALPRLAPMEIDGLVNIEGNRLSITEEGRPFLRNACMAFDARLWRKLPQSELFSKAV